MTPVNAAAPGGTPSATPSGTHSLRRRLLWFVSAAILMAALVQAATAYRGALQQADAMFDEHLQQVARSLRSGIPLGAVLPDGEERPGFDLYVQIWGPDGRQLYRSSHSVLPPRAILGFSDVRANGNLYRVYSLQTPLQTVQIAQDMGARTAKARSMALDAVLPFLLMTPLLMLAVWWVITRSLAPVERARRQVAGRAADDLSPLASDGLPDEVQPLVTELNLLFSRVKGAFDAQKNFVADAAHELRSPLTALKLQAQALRRQDDTPAAREAAVARFNQGIDRAIRLVEQLLLLARHENATGPIATSGTPASSAPVDLQDVVRLAVADVLPTAQARQIDLGLEAAEAASVSGQADALQILLRNLLENAIKYTPPGGRVDVHVRQQDGRAVLAVEDSGPGIAEQDRSRVFDRFFRAASGMAETGSGLGLAIVKAIADRHGASLRLDRSQALGGLRVELVFPPGFASAASA
ncbi:MAG: ATP-binding protein [Polaromonas sp.]|nr:ATP-binding protein [Polaromonas sp.]